MRQEEIDLCYLRMCKEYGKLSRCLSRKVGAVLVHPDGTPVAMGFNGPPRGVPHCANYDFCPHCFDIVRGESCSCGSTDRSPITGTCPRKLSGAEGHSTLDKCPAVHAEVNALLSCARTNNPTLGCSLYIYPIGPCKTCASLIINAGIKKLIFPQVKPYDELSPWLLGQSEIEVRTYPLEAIEV